MKKLFVLLTLILTVFILASCGETPHTHTMVEFAELSPTCTDAGHYPYEECSECGYSTYEEIPAFGHSIIMNDEVPAGCEEDGVRAHYECDECGLFFADEEGLTVISSESLVLQKTGHNDINHDFICDNRCGKLLFTEEMLNQILSNTFANTEATIHDYYLPGVNDTYYYISADSIRITYDTGAPDEIINREEGADALNIGSILSEKYDFACASEIEFNVCPIEPFENRPIYRYNSESIGIGLVLNEDATLLDGILIYDENGNIINAITVTVGAEG